MTVHVYATRPQYWRHLRPIVRELALADVEVQTWGTESWHEWGEPIRDNAGSFTERDAVLVASYDDAREFQRTEAAVIYLEHGAGQTYLDHDEGGWPGCRGLGHVDLFLCPNETVGDAWRARYPHADIAVVGCPALDGFVREPAGYVALATHWRCAVAPEAMTCVEEYRDALCALQDAYRMVGHAHPRMSGQVRSWWGDAQWCEDVDGLLRGAVLLIADNTSVMYEAAALDIPVVALNGKDYRRDVEHGLRFWSHVPGLQVDDPDELAAVVAAALDDPPAAKAMRAAAARRAYAAVAGSAPLAAEAVIAVKRRAPRMSENRSLFDELLIRLFAVGATDAEIEAFREQWPEMTPEERETLKRLNDVRLREEVLSARQDNEWQTTTPDEGAALEAARAAEAQSYAADEDALRLLAYDPQYIVNTVVQSPEPRDLAVRLAKLESAAPDPRMNLVQALAEVQ